MRRGSGHRKPDDSQPSGGAASARILPGIPAGRILSSMSSFCAPIKAHVLFFKLRSRSGSQYIQRVGFDSQHSRYLPACEAAARHKKYLALNWLQTGNHAAYACALLLGEEFVKRIAGFVIRQSFAMGTLFAA